MKIIFLGLLLLCATTLSAATYHVDQNSTAASDANAGTKDKPLKTISAGVAKVSAGDTVFVHPGVYRETVTLKTSGAEGKPITIEAAQKGTVTIRGSVPVKDWRPSEANKNIYVHEGWGKYFGKWDESLVKGGDQFKAKFGGPGSQALAFNQVFVNGTLIREVACPEKREAGTFYIDKEKKQIHCGWRIMPILIRASSK